MNQLGPCRHKNIRGISKTQLKLECSMNVHLPEKYFHNNFPSFPFVGLCALPAMVFFCEQQTNETITTEFHITEHFIMSLSTTYSPMPFKPHVQVKSCDDYASFKQQIRSGQVWGHTPKQSVAASTLRRYSFGLRPAIAQADARPTRSASFR